MSVLPRVLYVDDDVENGQMMTFWIREECGFDIAVAVDGAEAFRLIDTEFFDLFLLDYCLPDVTAVTLCEKIRERYPDAPIAIYSALDREIDKQRALAAGADLYMVKPDDLDKVRPFLKKHLDRRTVMAGKPGPSERDTAVFQRHQRSRFKPAGIV
ncbi:MAG: response regulator transcription factor [Pyrinomonadaceae bacterium]